MLLHNNYKNRLGLLFQIANQQINSYSLQANSRPLHGGTGLYLTNIQVYSIDYRLFDACYLTGNEASTVSLAIYSLLNVVDALSVCRAQRHRLPEFQTPENVVIRWEKI